MPTSMRSSALLEQVDRRRAVQREAARVDRASRAPRSARCSSTISSTSAPDPGEPLGEVARSRRTGRRCGNAAYFLEQPIAREGAQRTGSSASSAPKPTGAQRCRAPRHCRRRRRGAADRTHERCRSPRRGAARGRETRSVVAGADVEARARRARAGRSSTPPPKRRRIAQAAARPTQLRQLRPAARSGACAGSTARCAARSATGVTACAGGERAARVAAPRCSSRAQRAAARHGVALDAASGRPGRPRSARSASTASARGSSGRSPRAGAAIRRGYSASSLSWTRAARKAKPSSRRSTYGSVTSDAFHAEARRDLRELARELRADLAQVRSSSL